MAWVYQEDHYEFMSDRTYRSAPPSPWLYNDFLSRRVMASYGYQSASHCDTFGNVLVDNPDYHLVETIPVYLGFPRTRWYAGDVVGRNLRAAVANGAILSLDSYVQIQPMLTPTGCYPTDFSIPRRLIDFQEMEEQRLHRIMASYELVPHSSRYNEALRCPLLAPSFHHPARLANLIALLDFLAAYRIAEALRCRVRAMSQGMAPTRGQQYGWY